jgi:NAD(P)-dependent dehydrogenase (short-subunit alcohol dehydrogenase family)
MTSRFQKKNVFVTGAGSGFGRATALGFAREGAAVLYLVERLEDRLEAVRREVEAHGSRAVPLLADLADVASCETALRSALDDGGRLDVVVSNHAAMCWPTPFVDLTDEEWETQLRVNLTSSYVLAQRAARSMIGTGGGVILFTASVSSVGAGRGFAPYCATKTALVALAKVMAIELAPHGIRVNCVSPGPADTQRSVDLVGDEVMERFRRDYPIVPMNRLAAAEDVAEAFLYLASDAAAYVTGHNLVVDGGLTAGIPELPHE